MAIPITVYVPGMWVSLSRNTRTTVWATFRGMRNGFSLLLQEVVRMSTTTRSRGRRSRSKSRQRVVLQKPNGVLHPRVQRVEPEHFGIVSVDVAKSRSKWMLCDFYGNVIIEPVHVKHTKSGFENCIRDLHQGILEHDLKDLVVSVERTGNYHEAPKRAFREAGFEIRIVHPFATKQFRQPANPGDKTDDNDLAAIHRATVNGFGLTEPVLDELYRQLRILVRHRRYLVHRCTALSCQIRERLMLTMPGYAQCFKSLWESNIAIAVMRATGSAEAVKQLGVDGINKILVEQRIAFKNKSLHKILAWSESATPSDPDASVHHRICCHLVDDRVRKVHEIRALEAEICTLLVKTPYVLLLAIPGINVVSASDFAGEMGPITHYANANHITGRAGLFSGRYQSEDVDKRLGLVRCANKRLRNALMQIADNLVHCNNYFAGHAALWKQQKVDERLIRIRVAKRFTRVAYSAVSGRQRLHHRCCQPRDAILEKLNCFQLEHQVPMDQLLVNTNAAIDQMPTTVYREESVPLAEKLERFKSQPRRGPQPIGQILPQVVARLLGEQVQSDVSEDQVSN